MGLSYMGFNYVEVCSFYACFLFFIINGCWIFSNVFSAIYWDNYLVFILQFVNVVYHIDWFVNIEESLHPWDKAHLVTMYDLFNMFLELFARILLRIFASTFIPDIGLHFSFSVTCLSGQSSRQYGTGTKTEI